MEVTTFIVSGRDKAKLYGDYATYRTQLSNRIHNLRKKLGVATKPRAKHSSKIPTTAEDIGRNKEYAYLLLLTSERAWANAMSMREIHSTEKRGITGDTRSHIISRLQKATIYANDLFQLLTDQATTGATVEDVLEARAYAASLTGAKEFEKQAWDKCVRSYSQARIIYSALAISTKNITFNDLLTDPIDPSIRYGAYQMKLPRTIAITAIAQKYFPRSDTELISQLEKLDPDVLNDQPIKSKSTEAASGAVPKTITWRSRTVHLEDAAIATALGAVNESSVTLSQTLFSEKAAQAKDRASAYDDILILSQDAVDATKHAIEELVSEGVGQGDKRVQSLQITRTAVGYEMISWRIGRNRVLVGEHDGAVADSITLPSKKKSKHAVIEESTGRKLAHLREKSVLYDAILQSLDTIKELPGVAADSEFLEELQAKFNYFSALKCLTIARSHALLPAPKNALALLSLALSKSTHAHTYLSSQMDTSSPSSPPNISVSPNSSNFLNTLLQSEVQRYRALVELSTLSAPSAASTTSSVSKPLIERLHEYPSSVDLGNLVSYPPKLEPIPVKPLFFDAAWNYVQYPGRAVENQNQPQPASSKTSSGAKAESKEQAVEGKKKGWFGFTR